MIQIDINMPIGCIYEGDNGKTEYCPLCNHDDVPYCQYIDDDEAALGIDERPCYCPLYKSEPKWIPVSERLPELYKPVLVTGGDIIWICELIESPDLDDGEFQWEDKMLGHWYSFDNWDAWMPLPPAYKGDE